MSPHLTVAAAFAIALAGFSHRDEATAGGRIAGTAHPPAAVAVSRGYGTIQPRHARHRAYRRHSDICRIVNGWRAFPTRYRYGYFDTRPVRCHTWKRWR